MNPPQKMSRIVNGKRYSVQKSELIADNVYWDGNNLERNGRNSFLYKTKNGRYFTVNLTFWQGERDTLNPVNKNYAVDLFTKSLSEHHMTFEEAFPDVTIKEA